MLRWPLNFNNSALTYIVVAMSFVWLTLLAPSTVYSTEYAQNAQFDVTQPADITLMGKKGPPKSKVDSGKRSGLKGRGKVAGKPRMKRQGMRSVAKFRSNGNKARNKDKGKKKTSPVYKKSEFGKAGSKNLAKKRNTPPKTVGKSFGKREKTSGQQRTKKKADQGKKVPAYLNKKVSKKKKSNSASERGAIISSKWGRNRLVKELHKQGFVLDRRTRNNAGGLYRHPTSGAEVRIMDRPKQRYRNDAPAKHQSSQYYRKRSSADKAWGPHTSIPDK